MTPWQAARCVLELAGAVVLLAPRLGTHLLRTRVMHHPDPLGLDD